MILQDGLYEQVVNNEIRDELIDTDKHKELVGIDHAEAPKVLAKYVSEVIESGLKNLIDRGGSIDDQVRLTNQIISTVSKATEDPEYEKLQVTEEAEQLLALFDNQNNIWALDGRSQVARPETSIAQSSLFTGAVHEPQMYSELKREIISCDQIDMLVSFIKWSGLRLVMDELIMITIQPQIYHALFTAGGAGGEIQMWN